MQDTPARSQFICRSIVLAASPCRHCKSPPSYLIFSKMARATARSMATTHHIYSCAQSGEVAPSSILMLQCSCRNARAGTSKSVSGGVRQAARASFARAISYTSWQRGGAFRLCLLLRALVDAAGAPHHI